MENNTSILVKNYHKKNPEDSPHTTLVEFFSFCGPVKNYAIKEESNGSYMAIITFESPAAAQVSLLLNTAEIGLEGEHITVSIIQESEKPPLDYITINNPIISPSEASPVGPEDYTSDIIKLLIQKGYKLKDNVLELAKQAEPKVKEAFHTAGVTVATTGQVAYDVTQHQLNRLSEATTEAAQIATATVSSYVTANAPSSPRTDPTVGPPSGPLDSLKQAGEAVISTSQIALDITSNKIKEASAAVVNTGQVAIDKTTDVIQNSGAVDAIKQAGSAVVNTGQVAIDVTRNSIQQSGAVDAIKQAGSAVVNTGQVAIDVTSNALEQARSAVVNTSQVAIDVTTNAFQQSSNVIQQSGAVEAIKQAGSAVINTGQVAIDVTTNAIQQSGAVDAIKQAGAAVVTTGQLAVDITANTISNVINSLSDPKT